MIDKLLEGIMQAGPLGAVVGVMIWDNIKTKTKMFEVIENNTKAMTENTNATTNLAAAQQNRRGSDG